MHRCVRGCVEGGDKLLHQAIFFRNRKMREKYDAVMKKWESAILRAGEGAERERGTRLQDGATSAAEDARRRGDEEREHFWLDAVGVLLRPRSPRQGKFEQGWKRGPPPRCLQTCAIWTRERRAWCQRGRGYPLLRSQPQKRTAAMRLQTMLVLMAPFVLVALFTASAHRRTHERAVRRWQTSALAHRRRAARVARRPASRGVAASCQRGGAPADLSRGEGAGGGGG